MLNTLFIKVLIDFKITKYFFLEKCKKKKKNLIKPRTSIRQPSSQNYCDLNASPKIYILDLFHVQHRLFPKSTQAIPETNTQTSPPQFQDGSRSLAGVGRVHAQAVEGQMVEEPSPRLISVVLFAWAQVDTCHP
jgi:hypothetical protein